MIKYYHKTLKGRTVKELDKYEPGCWVYVQNSTVEELEEIAEKFNLDQGHLADSQDPEEMPRLEREDDQTYLFTRFAYMNEKDLLATTPLMMVFHPECLVTVSFEHIPGIEKMIEKKHIDTTQQGKLALQLLEQIDNQYENYLSIISKQIKTTRTRLREEQVSNQDFIDFVILEDELNEFMSALNPMTPILKRLMLGRHVKLHVDDKELIEDLLLNNEQSLEACRLNIKSIVNIREAYSTIMSNDLNRIIRILTVLTVLISVPTLIASVYGMNIDLPFADSESAFVQLMVLSFILSLFLLIYFKIKKWL